MKNLIEAARAVLEKKIKVGDIITNERNPKVTAKVVKVKGDDLTMQTKGEKDTWFLSAKTVDNKGNAGW